MTLTELQQLIDYNPSTGAVIWKSDRQGRVKKGDQVGNDKGKTRINGVNYNVAHLCVWLHRGRPPTHQVRFINGDVGDYRWSNLRILRPKIKRCKRPRHSIVIYEPQAHDFTVIEDAGIYQIENKVSGARYGFFMDSEQAYTALKEVQDDPKLFSIHSTV